MKLGRFLAKSEWGLLILTAVFLCLMAAVLFAVSPRGTAADYTITTRTPPADVTPEALPLLDLNTATAQELEALDGIGPALAERIVQYREENGPFTAVEELLYVQGIGPATLERFRDEITVGEAQG